MSPPPQRRARTQSRKVHGGARRRRAGHFNPIFSPRRGDHPPAGGIPPQGGSSPRQGGRGRRGEGGRERGGKGEASYPLGALTAAPPVRRAARRTLTVHAHEHAHGEPSDARAQSPHDMLCIRTAGDPGEIEIATTVGLKSKETNSLPVVLCNRACACDRAVPKIGCWRAHLTPLGGQTLQTA